MERDKEWHTNTRGLASFQWAVIGSPRSSEWTSHCKAKKKKRRKTMCTHFSKNPSSELLESLKFTTKKKTLPIGEIEKNSTTTIWKIYITNQSSYPWMEFELWTSIISSWLTTVLRRKAKAPKKEKKKKRGEREELGREQGKEKLLTCRKWATAYMLVTTCCGEHWMYMNVQGDK